MVEKQISNPAGSATRFSVAVNYKDGDEQVFRSELLRVEDVDPAGEAVFSLDSV